MPEQPSTYAPRHAVILAHPQPNGFNGLVAKAYCEAARALGHDAIIRDLYRIGFDPVLKEVERPRAAGFSLAADVEAELAALQGSDVFVLVYPIWFGMPPAMMVGYVDRVLGSGVTAPAVKDRTARTPLRGKRLLTITSSGASKSWLNEQYQIESLRDIFGRYLSHAFGMKSQDALHFGETVEGLSQDFVDQNMADVQDRARSICHELQSERETREAVAV